MANIDLAPKGHKYHKYQGWNTTINTKRIVEVKDPNLHARGGCSLTFVMRKSKKKNKVVEKHLYFSDYIEYTEKHGKCHIHDYMWNQEKVTEGRSLALSHAHQIKTKLVSKIK